MENYIITKTQILEIENGDLTLREIFPKAFAEPLVIGGIYEVNGMIIRYAGKISRASNSGAYGFTACGEFLQNLGLGEDDTFNKVDMKVWEDMLLNEAIKKGFVLGAKYSNDEKICTIKGEIKAHYMSGTESTKLTDGWGGSIFNHGVWERLAITQKEAEDTLGVKII
jgi:hypothetical protein